MRLSKHNETRELFGYGGENHSKLNTKRVHAPLLGGSGLPNGTERVHVVDKDCWARIERVPPNVTQLDLYVYQIGLPIDMKAEAKIAIKIGLQREVA